MDLIEIDRTEFSLKRMTGASWGDVDLEASTEIKKSATTIRELAEL